MLKKYRKLSKGEFITVGVDTSAGGTDYTCAQFVSRQNNDVPYIYHSKEMTTALTNQLPQVLEDIHGVTGVRPLVAYERNNGGVFEIERLSAMNRLNKYTIYQAPNYGRVDNPDPVKLGWDTNTATRPKMLSDLKDIIDHKVLRIYDKPTVSELLAFVIVQTSSSWKAQAESGAHDDTVMALAIAVQLYLYGKEPTAENILEAGYFGEEGLFTNDGFY